MSIWISAFLLTTVGGVTLGALYRHWRARRIQARRVVEKPNSHYSAPGVREREARERWGAIDLAHLHPLNREEVERLLSRADVLSVGALSARERTFLDHLVATRRR